MKQDVAYLRVSAEEQDTADQLTDMGKRVAAFGLSTGGLVSGTGISMERRASKRTGQADPGSAQAERGHTAGAESGSTDPPARHTHNTPSFPFAITLDTANQ